jgi:2-haloacid dehalogenase
MTSSAYVFDAYGTLFDVHSAAERHAMQIGSRWQTFSDIWRTKQLEYTWVRSLAGSRVTFWQVTEDALDFAIASVGGLEKGIRQELLSAYRELEAYPEVAGVLSGLKSKGARLGILSNGDPSMLEEAVHSAGLNDLFDAVLSVEPAGIFKPAPSVYVLVTNGFHSTPREISFQSSNRWDIAGAKAFGFRTVWINRGGRPDEYQDLPADDVLSDLRGLLVN